MSAERNLAPIRAKLRGANTGDATINSVPGQVDKLIKEATSSDNLVRDCESVGDGRLTLGCHVPGLGAVLVGDALFGWLFGWASRGHGRVRVSRDMTRRYEEAIYDTV